MTKSFLRIAKPGSGKTTRLIQEAQEVLSRGGTVFLTTFGKKNMEHMAQKMGWLSKEKQDHLKIQTLHSAAWHHLKPKRQANLTKYLFEHDTEFGLRFGSQLRRLAGAWSEDGSDPYTVDGETESDICYMEVQRLRSEGKTWRDTALLSPLADKVKQIFEILEDGFRRGGWDYTHLLEHAVRTGLTFRADYVGVDEINDLTPLQLAICRRAEGEKVVFTGDPQQAIFSFSGVHPEALYTLPGEVEVCEQSYRLPSVIAAQAETIIGRSTDKVLGHIKPVHEGGEVIRDGSFANVVSTILTEGRTLVLARTNAILERARHLALQYGANVTLTDEESLQAQLGQLIRTPTPNFNFSDIPCLLGEWLPAKEYFQAGGKKRLRERSTTDVNGWMSWDDLFRNYGTTALRELIEGRKAWYSGERSFDPRKPVATFQTIHSAKGLEEDTVVVLRDMGERVRRGLHTDEENEIRLAYVAATRAKRRLVITDIGGRVMNPYLA